MVGADVYLLHCAPLDPVPPPAGRERRAVSSVERLTFVPQVFTAGDWYDAPHVEPGRRVDVRLVTWNAWFGGHMFEDRCDALLAELQRRRADVIALQEVTPALLRALLDAPWIRASYQASQCEVTSYDVLILSRLTIRRLAQLELPTEMDRRLLVAELACGLAVATVHLESTREEAQARAAQLRIIQPALARYPDVALVGDMNFQPDDPVENAVLDPSLVDTWPALRPGEPGYTVDTDVNTMRLQVRSTPTHKRIDRVFLRSSHWQARSIELIGTRPIAPGGTFISDHFGLETVLTAA
ncbi:MAG TPA: endonuclease/exonuclease/phosphatase family protein [Kofleriaceae bacterium]|jgi:endonuclease/exonuclease/phosphatase family metal-dependent hydrolase|nr:endonuclease/exonuclease/phosphatase family protein [Kofleriaceae bacterium]